VRQDGVLDFDRSWIEADGVIEAAVMLVAAISSWALLVGAAAQQPPKSGTHTALMRRRRLTARHGCAHGRHGEHEQTQC
jgi:hypothetical protein